jgi:hypothetical protein
MWTSTAHEGCETPYNMCLAIKWEPSWMGLHLNNSIMWLLALPEVPRILSNFQKLGC